MARRTPSADDLARIARLELEAREIVEGFLTGPHRSPYFGASLEFAQHREYVPGDDTRRLDWKVFSKTDKLYLKLYEEETNLRTLLLVDASESMQFGAGPATTRRGRRRTRENDSPTKFDTACLIAASLAYLLLRQQDSVALMTFDEGVRTQVAGRTSQRHLQTLLEALATAKPTKKTGLFDVLLAAADQASQRGLVTLISDLFVPVDELKRGLSLLRQRRHEVLVLHTLDARELAFDFTGTTRFVGLEDGGELTCEPRTLREGYLSALDEWLDDVRRVCGQTGCDYQLVRSDDAPSAVLAELLARRKRPRRG